MTRNRNDQLIVSDVQYPTGFAYSATPSLDVSANNAHVMTDEMTADMALTLLNGADGDAGVIMVAQDGTGGWKITDIAAAGRTVLMRDDLVTINTVAFKVADAISLIAYEFVTVNGVGILFLSVSTGIAAAFT